MVEFLSDAWFDALGSVALPADASISFRLDQAITGAPGGDIRYRVIVGGGRVRVERPGGADPPDATLRLAYRTAVDLARGERTAHDALLSGEVTFDGDPARVQQLAGAMGVIGSAFVELRACTHFTPS